MFDSSGLYQVLPLIVFLVILYGVLIIAGLVSYVLRAIGIMRLSDVHGLQSGWLGFIPIAAEYQLGKIAGEVEFGSKRMKKPGVWMVVLPLIVYGIFYAIYFVFLFSIISMVEASSFRYYDAPNLMFATPFLLFFVFYIVVLAGVLMIAILRMMVVYKIFSRFYDGHRPVFSMLLCAFVPLAEPILLFGLAKKPMIHAPEYPREKPAYPPYPGYPPQYPGYPPPNYGQQYPPQPPQYYGQQTYGQPDAWPQAGPYTTGSAPRQEPKADKVDPENNDNQ